MRTKIDVYDQGTLHGPAANPILSIEDPDEVGVTEYANDAGECYFTLPHGHAAHSVLSPLLSHIGVQRQANEGEAWTTIWRGLLADKAPGPDETTYYGDNYLSLLNSTLTTRGTKYTSKAISDILEAEAIAAIRQASTGAISVVGLSTKPGAVYYDITYNSLQTGNYTIPADGTIGKLGGWFRGYLSGGDFALCVWDASSGDLLASTSKFTVTGASKLYANVLKWEKPLAVPLEVTAGQTVRFGWACDPAKAALFTVATGTHYRKDVTGTWPGSMAGAASVTGDIAAYGIFTATDVSTNSRLGFVSIGTIGSVSSTISLPTEYQPRLSFLQGLIQIAQQGATTRPIMSISRTSPFTFDFAVNAGQDRGIVLQYGGLLDSYRSLAGYGNLATTIRGVGQKIAGDTVLYSTQTSLDEATYGTIERASIYQLVADQTAMDNITKFEATQAAQLYRNLSLAIRSGQLAPYGGFELGDSLYVNINRSPIAIAMELYTIWGLEWIGYGNGMENTSLLLSPKLV